MAVCVCVETEGCKLEELAAQELLGSDFTFLKEVTQRACCLLIDHCCVLQLHILQWECLKCLWLPGAFELLLKP